MVILQVLEKNMSINLVDSEKNRIFDILNNLNNKLWQSILKLQ
jgi:hypothetical protein